MTEPRSSSAWVAITVAIIGLIGSLGVAWMTTQAKFAQELDSKGSELVQLKVQLEQADKRLQEQQQEMDKKIAAVEDRLKKLDMQIELAQAAASKLTKLSSSLLSGGNKKDK